MICSNNNNIDRWRQKLVKQILDKNYTFSFFIFIPVLLLLLLPLGGFLTCWPFQLKTKTNTAGDFLENFVCWKLYIPYSCRVNTFFSRTRFEAVSTTFHILIVLSTVYISIALYHKFTTSAIRLVSVLIRKHFVGKVCHYKSHIIPRA